MPREQINYPDMMRKYRTAAAFKEHDGIPDPDEPAGRPVDWNEAALHVSWLPRSDKSDSMSGWVQVAFEVDTEYLDSFQRTTEDMSHGDRVMLWTDVLTPGDVMRMIAVLKKALRKAYPPAE